MMQWSAVRRAGLVLALVATPLVAQDAAPVRGATVEGITEYTLENGMKVLLFPDASRPTTTVNVTYFVGSRHEAYGETGMAHLLEHLVFKGTPRHPNIMQELSERGASPNGTTWYDRTNYFETFPANNDNLAWALDLEADRMVNSFISAEDLASEMTVVRNEFEAGENDPTGVLMERVFSTAYLWHNYGKSTIGARSDIENVPIDRLQGFYRKYYQPDNAMLVVAGKFDPDTALAMIQRTFGKIPRPDRSGANRIWPTYTLDPVQDGEREVTLRRVGDVKSVMIAWHVPHGSHPDFAAVDVLAHVLGAPVTGRLYKAIVEPKIGASVNVFPFQLREPGLLMAMATVRKEDDVYAGRDAMLRAIDSMLAHAPVSQEEVDRARTALLKQIELQLTNPNSVGLSMSEWASMGDWRLMFIHRDRIRNVTPDDVMRVASAYLKSSNRTVGVFLPDSAPDRAELPPAPDVLAMVQDYRGDTTMVVGEDFDPSPENLDRRTTTGTLANGVEFAFLPKQTRGGTVNVSMTFRFGTEESLSNLGAIPMLTGQMLMRGTRSLTRQELRDSIDKLQAQMGVGGSTAQVNASITVKRENLLDAIRLAVQVMREPRFDEQEFELLKQAMLASIESQRSEPQMIAMVTAERHVSPWPEGHPLYVPTVDEQIAYIREATLSDVRRFYDRFYGGSHGQVAVVGAFDPDEVRAVLEEALAGWESPMPFRRIASPAGKSTPLDVNLETPDKANAMLVATRSLPIRDDAADYPAMILADYLLGGGVLNSRLATRIRQKEGLSYGVGSFFSASPTDSVGTWTAYAIFAPENRDKVLNALREELIRAAKEGFTAEEIAKAKEGWVESNKLGRSNDGAVAGRLVNNLYLDRDFARQSKLEAEVMAVTDEQLRAVVTRYLDPAGLAIVKAGDFRPRTPDKQVP
jgi:zinc protease